MARLSVGEQRFEEDRVSRGLFIGDDKGNEKEARVSSAVGSQRRGGYGGRLVVAPGVGRLCQSLAVARRSPSVEASRYGMKPNFVWIKRSPWHCSLFGYL